MPAKPTIPKPAPSFSAVYGWMVPLTRGLWEVLSICLSFSISMYWLRVWVDIESMMDEAKRGRQLKEVV
jgi:hypothetical protein